jgi:hypothetical protein
VVCGKYTVSRQLQSINEVLKIAAAIVAKLIEFLETEF